MRRIVHVVLLGFAASMLMFALTRAPDANASVDYTSPYTFDQTYGAGLRLLHVDMGLKIIEKDRDLGYVLFEYSSPESGKSVYQGSMELVETKTGVHVAIQIPSMPQYHERMIVDKLGKKLEAEYGDPPQRKKDGDKDKDKDKSDGDKDKDADKSDGDKDKSDGNKDKDADKPKN
ncbi:MAG TPA: hypothetical protein VL400_06630 [Polyangiaceae bacterium]|nr:hypothetical protein [Polyangiaceae bacterium]